MSALKLHISVVSGPGAPIWRFQCFIGETYESNHKIWRGSTCYCPFCAFLVETDEPSWTNTSEGLKDTKMV